MRVLFAYQLAACVSLLPAPPVFAWTEYPVDGWRVPIDVEPADLDGDGDLDAAGLADDIWGNDGGRVCWWENADGQAGDWVEHVVDGDFPDGRQFAAADLDGDGDRDLVAIANGGDNESLVWWENAGGDGSSWTFTVIDGETNDAGITLETVDIDGDGDLDILSGAFGWVEVS